MQGKKKKKEQLSVGKKLQLPQKKIFEILLTHVKLCVRTQIKLNFGNFLHQESVRMKKSLIG